MILFNTPITYKKLCYELDVPAFGGSKQRTQLAQLSELYDIEKTDNSRYIIHKQYNELEQIEHKRQGKYKAYLTPMIYTILNSASDNIMRCSMNKLLELLTIVNKDYSFAKWNINKVDEHLLDGNRGGLQYFIREVDTKYRKIIKDILNEMADQKLIEVNPILMFACRFKNEQGEIKTKVWEAKKEDEISIFLDAQRYMLDKIKLDTWSEFSKLSIYARNEGREVIVEKIKETLNVDYFYYEYEIILNKKGIQNMILKSPMNTHVSFNRFVQSKIAESECKDLTLINDADKNIYIDSFIDITNDYNLREKLK